jgi:hypothetical protein
MIFNVGVILILILLICAYVGIITKTLKKTSFYFTYFPIFWVFTSCNLSEKNVNIRELFRCRLPAEALWVLSLLCHSIGRFWVNSAFQFIIMGSFPNGKASSSVWLAFHVYFLLSTNAWWLSTRISYAFVFEGDDNTMLVGPVVECETLDVCWCGLCQATTPRGEAFPPSSWLFECRRRVDIIRSLSAPYSWANSDSDWWLVKLLAKRMN